MASSSSSPAPARPWVILGRIARVEDPGDLSVELAAPPLVSTITAPASLYRFPKYIDGRGDLSVALAERARVSDLAAPTSARAMHNHDDNDEHPCGDATGDREDLSVALAERPRVSDLAVLTRTRDKLNYDDSEKHPCGDATEDRGEISVALAVKRLVSASTAPFNVAKSYYDETGKQPYVVPDDDADCEDTWGLSNDDDDADKHSYVGAADKHPYVVAADDAGLLLYVSDGPFVGFDLDRAARGILVVARGFLSSDTAAQLEAPTATGTAVRVPERGLDQPGISNIKNLGLVSLPGSGGAEFVVAELRLVGGADDVVDHATLLCFRSGMEAWVERDLSFPSSLLGLPKAWSSHDVIAHDGKLWWVDLVWGLLGCDPFADEHELELRHVTLPLASADNGTVESPPSTESNRIVTVSQGKLRCVDMCCDLAGAVEETIIAIKLLKFGTAEASWDWELQSANSLGVIWASESYRGTGMPEEVPLLALLHPSNPEVVYFFLRQYLFSLNLAEGRVLEFVHEVDQPTGWRHALAWELPSSLANEIGALDTGGAATEGESSIGQLKEDAEQGANSRLCCVACQQEAVGNICGRCATLIKEKLLGVAADAMSVPGNGNLLYCLVCHELKRKHKVHEPNSIPISSYEGEPVAWVSGKEPWAAIFAGIQSDRCRRPAMGRPYLLYRPLGIYCTVCLDILSTDLLYGSLLSFCCIKCWARGGGAADDVQWVEDMLAIDFEDGTDAFCISCGVGFHSHDDNGHEEHQYICIITDSWGRWPRVQIPPEHKLLHTWESIKKQEDPASGNMEILIRDDRSLRCQRCRMRLLDGGGKSCSFDCALSLPQLLPRPLLLKQCGG